MMKVSTDILRKKTDKYEDFYKNCFDPRGRNNHRNISFCGWPNDKLKPECSLLA